MTGSRQMRPLKPEEYNAHLAMLNLAFAPWGSQEDWAHKYTQPGFDPARNVLVAEQDGEWIGGGSAWFREALINGKKVPVYLPGDLYTHPEHQGKGVYSMAMKSLNSLGKERGAVLGMTFPSLRAMPYHALTHYGFCDVFQPSTKIKLLRPAGLIELLADERISILHKLEGKHIKLAVDSDVFWLQIKDSALVRIAAVEHPHIFVISDFTTLFRLFAAYRRGKFALVSSAVGALLSGKLRFRSSVVNFFKMVFA